MSSIVGVITEIEAITGSLTETDSMTAVFESQPVREYGGEYIYTPTVQTQVIEIQHKMATQNITINPIPYNYGLITWDGTKLTVS